MFDTEKFIKEIEDRPPIWNVYNADYSSREVKVMLWEELVDLFVVEDTSDENYRKDAVIGLQKKWKNIRDSFTRELRRLENPEDGPAAKRKKSYIYFKNLEFLKESVQHTLDHSEETEDITLEYKPCRNELRKTIKKANLNNSRKLDGESIKNSKLDEKIGSNLINILSESVLSEKQREKNDELDGDRMFLLSLLSDLKKIPEEKKLSAKLELIKVIQKAQLGQT